VGILALHGRDPAEAASLSADELRRLADDPVAEPAFGLVTAAPVSGATYTDETLSGHAANRYLYRVRSVSASGVQGPLGPASPPVRVPDVVPPAAPRVVRATGGDGVIELTIAANREPDADRYVVYRTGVATDAGDVRRMTPVGTAPHGPGRTIAFTDATAPPQADQVYRVVCVDVAGNASAASRPVTARCFSTQTGSPAPR
jgi:hypothetical protein